MSKSTGVTSPEPVHRVVTGHDERGSAVYLHDDHPPSTSYYQKPGMEAKFTVRPGCPAPAQLVLAD